MYLLTGQAMYLQGNIERRSNNYFTLFSFQLDTLTILYIYNLGSFIYLYMFRTDRSIIRRLNAFIAQAASGTVPSVVVCLSV
jgi:hypothetical protein